MSRQGNVLFQPGKNYKNFKVLKKKEIVELRSTLYELVHIPTGAQIMHLENDDIENVFCLSFQTLPESSNGVAHILEHTVLCGSEKYPIKDPFFAMNRRSLNTYMNALTGSDFTCYPAATQVPKDFYNLLEVYLDAVFKPTLKETSFLQEGHRLEFSAPEDPSSPLIYKGIVFNEMKGSQSSPETRMWRAIMHHLFPDTPYGFNSGGDPQEITRLSYQELLEFFKTYYHPGRCLFYFYGNLPLSDHLDFLEKHAFQGISKIPSLPPIPKQKRFTQPVIVKETYPITQLEDPNDKTLICLGWLTCPIQEQQDALALLVLDLVLMGTDASPLKHALLRSGLCKQADAMVDFDINELPFLIVCKGCKTENASALSKFIMSTLKQIAEEGFPQRLIDAAIHQLEFSRSEIGGGHTPFGLSLFLRGGLLKQHGVNPEAGLLIHALFETLRQCSEDPKYLPQILTRYLINNPHRVELRLEPDALLAARELEIEKASLEAIHAALTPEEAQKIIETTAELAFLQEQQEKEDIEVLPKVTLLDVSSDIREFALVEDLLNQTLIYHHPCFTNQIVYADYHFDLPYISEKDFPLLRLFASFLPELGNNQGDYKTILENIQEHTGGVGAMLSLHLQANDYHSFKPAIGFRGKALYRKVDKLFPLMKEMLASADFSDSVRIKELLLQHHTSLENSLNSNALKYATNLSTIGISKASQISNAWYGMDYVLSIRKIVKEFESNPASLIKAFQSLQETLLGLSGGQLVLSCDDEMFKFLKREDFFGLCTASNKLHKPWEADFDSAKIFSHGRIISAPVAFNSLTYKSLPYTHAEAPVLSIAAHLFENKSLHRRIREQGGAYGAGATNNPTAGQFTFYSYRDPHIASTFKAFHESIERIAMGGFTPRDLEEAKIGILQNLDAPIPPGARASLAFSWKRSGKEFDARRSYREVLLSTRVDDVKKTVQKHFYSQDNRPVFVTFAGEALLEKEAPLVGDHPLPFYPI